MEVPTSAHGAANVQPTLTPTSQPSLAPPASPTSQPSLEPSALPSQRPTNIPTRPHSAAQPAPSSLPTSLPLRANEPALATAHGIAGARTYSAATPAPSSLPISAPSQVPFQPHRLSRLPLRRTFGCRPDRASSASPTKVLLPRRHTFRHRCPVSFHRAIAASDLSPSSLPVPAPSQLPVPAPTSLQPLALERSASAPSSFLCLCRRRHRRHYLHRSHQPCHHRRRAFPTLTLVGAISISYAPSFSKTVGDVFQRQERHIQRSTLSRALAGANTRVRGPHSHHLRSHPHFRRCSVASPVATCYVQPRT